MADENLDSGQNDTDSTGGEDQATDTNTLLGGGEADTGQAAADEQNVGDDAGDNKDDQNADGEDDADKGKDKDGDEAGDDAGDEVPEVYEYEMPEGMEMDEALAEAVSPILKKYNVTAKDAQALADSLANSQMAGAAALSDMQADQFNQQLENWAGELRDDPEIGGDAFAENAKIASDAISKFGSPELTDLLNSTGYGNNPALFKFALKVGRLTAEDQPGRGGFSQPDQPIENRLYNPDGSPKKT